jgi:drug/metabolite transporter (DMT)-like permease
VISAATSSLSPAIVAAVLGAALLHAVWNSMAHAISDRLAGFALIGVVETTVGVALVLAFGAPPRQAWPYLVAAVLAHVAYKMLLLSSYELGDFSQAYPLARGTAPLLVAVVSVTIVGRSLTALEVVGILAISAGLAALVFAGGRPATADLPALAAALATGAMIAAYTVVDALGVGQAPLLVYTGWLSLLQGPALPLLALARRRGQLLGQLRRCARTGLTGGAISVAAYTVILWAQQSGAMAPIAALRETSIVFGAVIGAVFMGERLGYRRAAAATVVLLGAALLALT